MDEATILHADVDAFFAAVEQRDDPRLRGRPVLVGAWVVLAASYEAKARGVDTPMGVARALRLCPNAVVVEPLGAHPSYVQGAYDRDNRFYLEWDAITKDEAALQAWLREWVYDLDGRAAYVDKLGVERVAGLRPGTAPSGSVDYGRYE